MTPGLPYPEDGALRVQRDAHPARTGHVEGAGEDFPAIVGDLLRATVHSVAGEVGRPRRRLVWTLLGADTRCEVAVALTHLIVTELLAAIDVGPAQNGGVKLLCGVDVGNGEVYPARCACRPGGGTDRHENLLGWLRAQPSTYL